MLANELIGIGTPAAYVALFGVLLGVFTRYRGGDIRAVLASATCPGSQLAVLAAAHAFAFQGVIGWGTLHVVAALSILGALYDIALIRAFSADDYARIDLVRLQALEERVRHLRKTKEMEADWSVRQSDARRRIAAWLDEMADGLDAGKVPSALEHIPDDLRNLDYATASELELVLAIRVRAARARGLTVDARIDGRDEVASVDSGACAIAAYAIDSVLSCIPDAVGVCLELRAHCSHGIFALEMTACEGLGLSKQAEAERALRPIATIATRSGGELDFQVNPDGLMLSLAVPQRMMKSDSFGEAPFLA